MEFTCTSAFEIIRPIPFDPPETKATLFATQNKDSIRSDIFSQNTTLILQNKETTIQSHTFKEKMANFGEVNLFFFFFSFFDISNLVHCDLLLIV